MNQKAYHVMMNKKENKMNRCCKCGRPLFISKRILRDGNRICNACICELPIDLTEYCLNKYSNNDLSGLWKYITETSGKYVNIFSPTDTCGYIRLDSKHSLFKLNSSLIIYSVKDLKKCEFAFTESEKEDGTYDFTLTIASETPKYEIELPIKTGMSLEGITNTSVGNDFKECLPKEIIEFMDAFYRCFTSSKIEEFESKVSEYKNAIRV